MSLTLSVVTPSFNQGQFLERTIRSVLSQEDAATEYVVMDGGSKDSSIRVLRDYQTRLRWVSEPDRGQAHAVNKGLAATSGEIIGWVNSDDVYRPGAFRTVLAYFGAHPEADVVYGDADFIDEKDQAISGYPTEPWDANRLRDFCFLCQPAVFFRRRVLVRCGLLDEKLRYCMDYEYWLRLAEQGCRFVYLPAGLASSRIYTTNKTFGCRGRVHEEINEMLAGRYGTVPGHWLVNYTCAVLAETTPRFMRPLTFIGGFVPLLCYASWRWNRRAAVHWSHWSEIITGIYEKASYFFHPRHPRPHLTTPSR
jgi:glycosyltransferase involved in cell wall biosynthesis